MQTESAAQNWHDLNYLSHDGLKLYGRHYPAPGSKRRPLLCLPGLTRNSQDFHKLASYLSRFPDAPRNVYCLDYRGRGRSDHDPDWRNYTPFIELLDTLDFMTLKGLHNATVLGTSRGGMIAMMMAVVRPTNMGAVILNDIGPVIEAAGLTRIKGYVGMKLVPFSWEEAANIAKMANQHFFPKLTDDDWLEIAHQWFMEDHEGGPLLSYDQKLSRTLAGCDLVDSLSPMWPQFKALSLLPTLVIRGGNSDILSAETLEQMTACHPLMETLVVEEEGHAPLLRDEPSQAHIAAFLKSF